MAQAGAVNGQGSCVRGGGSVTAQSGEVQWLGLETLNWGAGNGSGTGSRRRQNWTQGTALLGAQGTAGRGRM